MKLKLKIEPVEVFAGTSWQAGIVKSMLLDVEVEAFLKNNYTGTLSPWLIASGGAGAVKVYVSSVDYVRAKFVIDGFEKVE